MLKHAAGEGYDYDADLFKVILLCVTLIDIVKKNLKLNILAVAAIT